MSSYLLPLLYQRFPESQSSNKGKKTDALGDVYEWLIIETFNNVSQLLRNPQALLEQDLIHRFFQKIGASISCIQSVQATNAGIPRTANQGSPKTDVIISITYIDGTTEIFPLSIKQSTRSIVAFAEYDVATILSAVGITDPVIEALMNKHQTDASAKNFTPEEKRELTVQLAPHADRFVRWAVTLSPIPCRGNISHPEYVIRFSLNSDFFLEEYNIYSIDEYVRKITHRGENRAIAGFGTGLSWTYATGSKGKKMQFKG